MYPAFELGSYNRDFANESICETRIANTNSAKQHVFCCQGADNLLIQSLCRRRSALVTALSGSFGHSWEAEGTEENSPAKAEQYNSGA
jgi:hypothetical protein